MNSDFHKDWCPDWCENCNKQGIYFADDLNSYYLIKHPLCGYESLNAHCSKCDIGYAFPIEDGNYIESWKCAQCNTQYSIPPETYNHFITLYIADELPEEVRDRVLPKETTSSRILTSLPVIAFVLYFIYLIIKELK